MKDQQVIITLRNDSIVSGTISSVDSNMNIELRNATIRPDPFYDTTEIALPHDDDDHEHETDINQSINSIASHTTEKVDVSLNLDQDLDQSMNEDSADDEDNDNGNDTLEETLEYFVVKGSRVRHIDIPDDFDLIGRAKQEIERIRNRRKQWTKRDIVRSSQ